MREFTTPLLVEPSGHRNATELLMQRFRTSPEHIAFEVRARERGDHGSLAPGDHPAVR